MARAAHLHARPASPPSPQVAACLGKFDKFSVRASVATREVVAVMEVEDGHLLELAVGGLGWVEGRLGGL